MVGIPVFQVIGPGSIPGADTHYVKRGPHQTKILEGAPYRRSVYLRRSINSFTTAFASME